MATRLQFQPTETKTGPATPTQLADPMETGVTPAPQTTTAATTTTGRLTVLPVQHQVEKELTGRQPR